MFKPITLPESLQEHDFDALQRKEKNPRVKARLLAMAHLKDGTPYKQVARMLRVHEKSLLKWIRRFANDGLEGLQERGGRGARPRLASERHETFKQAVLAYQANLPGGRMMGEDARRLLQEQFQVELSLTRVYALLHRMGLSWVSSRSRHPKHNPQAQADFKKTSVHRPKPSFRRI
jgi:transposase